MDAPFEEGLWVGVWWVLLGLDQQVRHAQLQVNLRREQGEVEIVQKNAKKKKTQKEGKESFKSRNKEQTGLGAPGCFP